MTNTSPPQLADGVPLPRLSDDAAAEIYLFLEHLFQLFEARYGDQITRFYDSMSRDKIVGYDGDPQPGDPPF